MLPVALERWRGAIIITAIFTNTAAIFTNISTNSSSLYAAV